MYEVGKNAMGCLEYLLIDLSRKKAVHMNVWGRQECNGVFRIFIDRFI